MMTDRLYPAVVGINLKTAKTLGLRIPPVAAGTGGSGD
jgi:hypothetical protein